MEAPAIEPIKLVVCIVPRGRSERITELCLRARIAFHLTLLGHGTADSSILDYLGLGETEKDVMLLCIKKSAADAFLQQLSDALHLEQPGHGIAFSIPLSSVAERSTLQLLSGFSIPKQTGGTNHHAV